MHDAFVEVEGRAGDGGPDVLVGHLAGALGGDEGLHGGELVRGRGAGDATSEHVGDPGFVIRAGGHGLGAEGAGGLHEHLVVEERERLERAVGDVAAGDARFAGRSVEGRRHRERGGALDERVERTAVAVFAFAGLPFDASVGAFAGHAGGLRRIDAGSAHLGGEQAGGAERAVADEFGVEAEAAAAGEQEVLAILFGELRRHDGRLLVRGAGDDQAMELLHRPAGLHELDGEPVEQLRVGRRLALVAEVLERAHEAAAEEGLPLAVDRDARGERVLRGEEPAGERQAVGRGVFGQGREERRHGRRNLLLRAEVFAAMMAEGRTGMGFGALAHHEGGLAARDLFPQVGERLGVDGQFGGGLEEALAELGGVVRGGAGKHRLDLGRVAGGRRLRVGGDRDAEVSQRTSVVLLEQHLERPAGGEVGRLVEAEDRGVVLAEAAEDLPAAGHLAVERGGGVVLLAIRGGLGGLLGVIRRSLGRCLRGR